MRLPQLSPASQTVAVILLATALYEMAITTRLSQLIKLATSSSHTPPLEEKKPPTHIQNEGITAQVPSTAVI